MGSAAADGDDYLDVVALVEQHFGVPSARHDLAVAFDGDALAGMAERFDERGNAQGGGGRREVAGFAIDDQFH
jgi:phosphatidylserine/phosphatidylglycerophosphate/cardiolipin synthase-like enzyme